MEASYGMTGGTHDIDKNILLRAAKGAELFFKECMKLIKNLLEPNT